MVARTSRRDFLRAGFLRPEVVRPYGASDAATFEKFCDGCGDCVAACPEEIIFRGKDGKAQVDLSRAECTFCEVCIEVCPTEALTSQGRDAWSWKAKLKDSCLAVSGVTCRTCEDFCDHSAIRFRLETGGRARPVIDEESCVGCGACASSCPADAIDFARQNPSQPPEQREMPA